MNILITGGASGLGAAITAKLAEDKENNIYFTYNSSLDAAKKIEAQHSNAKGIACDFRNPDHLENLQKEIEKANIDVLVNNALIGFQKKHFRKITGEEMVESFQQNVLPTLQITQFAVDVFRKKKFGKIITILTSALVGNPPIGWSEYVANKAYLLSMSKSWATEYIKSNITSNCISPSFMATNLNSDTDERILEEMIKNHPLKKLLTPEEVADAVHFFVNASQQINGQHLIINHGENLL